MKYLEKIVQTERMRLEVLYSLENFTYSIKPYSDGVTTGSVPTLPRKIEKRSKTGVLI